MVQPRPFDLSRVMVRMALPELIEIVPVRTCLDAAITVPGSKSITNRALVLAALAEGETLLRGALWSEDTQVMVECLQELGFMVNVEGDPQEACNRAITVYGKGGLVPSGGTAGQPMELFVGNAGTAARFLAALVCLGHGTYRLHGVPRMHQRPQAALFQALRSLGYRIDSPNDKLPAVIHGAGPRPGKCQVSIAESSQFASALMLCSGVGGWQISVSGDDADEASYVTMTSRMLEAFPKTGGIFQVEPDASSGSYFLGANRMGLPEQSAQQFGAEVSTNYIGKISVAHWPQSGWQIDERFPEVMARAGGTFSRLPKHRPPVANAPTGPSRGEGAISRARDLGDSIMTAIVLAPFADQPMRFTDLGRLRVQECERVVALRTELTKCGAKVIESGDTLEVSPGGLHGAEIETYNDHRVAMCFAILGLKVPGLRIKNPACVKKTFPNFFQKLARPAPAGLGATILEAHTRRPLTVEELFAE